jgi:hypothetical protein
MPMEIRFIFLNLHITKSDESVKWLRGDGNPRWAESSEEAKSRNTFQEKRYMQSVPETDTGGQVENTKALEWITVKELGKLVS